MEKINAKSTHILAIAPSTRGFGFAVLEEQGVLVNWGGMRTEGDKNTKAVAKVEKMIAEVRPAVMVLEDTSAKGSRRSHRIRELSENIIALAASRNVRVKLFSREQVMRAFFADGKGTNHGIAEIIANRFPEELGFRLPRKRLPWKSEAYGMSMFYAVALAMTYRLWKRIR